MSNFENARSSAPTSPLRTWDFMETTFVGLLAYGAFILTAELQDLTMQSRSHDAVLILASPSAIAVLWIAIRKADRGFSEYLALNWPTAGELIRALAITAIILMVEFFVRSSARAADAAIIARLGAYGAGGMMLWISACIVAPLMEEFVVRGFMFRGWSESFLGPIGAIVLTSLVWAILHSQYDWFGRFWIFISGLALGHFRWRSNSTWLAVMVHSAMNIFVFMPLGRYA
jgi:membrane protease YdiL (CAAX protease family)